MSYKYYHCSSLSSVTIPNSVTSIGEWAFFNCSSLTSVAIPNSVTAIGYFAFYKCSSLAAVIISNNVTTIGDMTFCNCSKLTSVTIPNSVISVRLWAFRNCSSLTSVTIGNSVKSIGEKAFEDCSGLTSVSCLNPQPPTCYTNTNIDYSIPLYAPQGSTLQYKAAEGWRNFVIIRELNGNDDIYLTINDGAKGNIEIKVDKEKPYFTLRVQPEIGWHIYSVSFNGETVTGEIDSDGTYTTPTINQNSELNIVYAQGASSAPSLENPHIHFSSTENSIVINGTSGGESISVCSLDGKCLAKVVASGYTTEIPLYTHQTYLIKINQSVFKVSM